MTCLSTRLPLTTAAAFAIVFATPALAHPGHVETLGGHAHWFALAAFAIAGVGLAALLVARARARTARKTADRSVDDATRADAS